MGTRIARNTPILLVSAIALMLAVVLTAGCTTQNGTDAGANAPGSQSQYTPPTQQAPPKYSSWVVNIVDDQESSQGGMTYTIALNLNATNPSSYKHGTYKGTATAKTTTTGQVGKGTLEAEAIANSTQLQFTLEDPEAGAPLASLDQDSLTYSGKGTITMKAAGTAHVGAAAGGFSNTSAQPFTISATGDKVTMDINIDGKKFTFHGTISGR
jgi:hypothetical protein